MASDILIVDDEEDIRELVAGILEDEGHETRTAGDADSALEAIAARRPSLVFLDIWLQGSRLDGLEILAEIKAQHPEVPVVMISGHGNVETAVSAIKSGSGTIGYADLSQVGDLNVANVKVGNEYVAPSPEAAVKIFEASKRIPGEGQYVFAYDLDRTSKAAGLYPISLVSYEMACTTYDKADEAKLVKAFYSFIISEEGQQASASAAGSAPIPDSLRKQISPAVEAIQTS